jgi:radical SAM superfamily enzyme YgiQ (UPF0313 family)
VSTYELGRQPFGLASPAAWLRQNGISTQCIDASVESLPNDTLKEANLIAFYIPMHIATQLAIPILKKSRQINPNAHICFYGLYASINESFLRNQGANSIIGGEFEDELVALCKKLKTNGQYSYKGESTGPVILPKKQVFKVPDRRDLPSLTQYARLLINDTTSKTTGYVETTRGCKHKCRHCPIVPVYNGKFRIVQKNIVMADIIQQIEAGAEHITFGDPDFFNGPGHTLPIINSLHEKLPWITYDVTIKIEHLLKHRRFLPILKKSGCAFVTSAVESIDNRVLKLFDKGHTKDDFLRVVKIFHELELNLNPTFVTFTPWSTLENYRELLRLLLELGLAENVAPIQLAIRLLIPNGSKLLELQEVRNVIGKFNEEKLSYEWHNPDPKVEKLYHDIFDLVKATKSSDLTRMQIFRAVWDCLNRITDNKEIFPEHSAITPRSTIPYLNEPWYC